MTLLLNEDQVMLQDAARGFCQQYAPVSQLRKLRDSKDETGFDKSVWQQMVDLGWTGMAIPEAYGGFGFGYHGLGIVLEESGRKLVCSPLIGTVLLGASAINELGSEQQKQDLLPAVVAGEVLLAFAVDETPIHRPHHTRTTATRSGNDYVINGSKCFVLDGHVANKIIVEACTDDSDSNGVSLFLVDCRNCDNIEFSNVKVSSSARLGATGIGAAGLDRILDIGRIGLSAEMLGSVQEAFDRTIDYLKQRQQFGVPIGAFQGLQHRAATMYSEIELGRSLVRAALNALDDDNKTAAEIAELASMAKAKLSEVFYLVSNEGIQMHGGIGMTDEFDIGFYLKRARVAQQYLGDASYHRDRIATLNNF
ncbi:MAG: acyl-CoA dehydrogenase family protein [Gammaproteobacteria bacterium]